MLYSFCSYVTFTAFSSCLLLKLTSFKQKRIFVVPLQAARETSWQSCGRNIAPRESRGLFANLAHSIPIVYGPSQSCVSVQALASELDAHHPTRVICAAGLTGRPNVDWCENHHAEVIRVNVCGTCTLADECAKRGCMISILIERILRKLAESTFWDATWHISRSVRGKTSYYVYCRNTHDALCDGMYIWVWRRSHDWRYGIQWRMPTELCRYVAIINMAICITLRAAEVKGSEWRLRNSHLMWNHFLFPKTRIVLQQDQSDGGGTAEVFPERTDTTVFFFFVMSLFSMQCHVFS